MTRKNTTRYNGPMMVRTVATEADAAIAQPATPGEFLYVEETGAMKRWDGVSGRFVGQVDSITDPLTGGIKTMSGTRDAMAGVSRSPVVGKTGMRIVGGRMTNVHGNAGTITVFDALIAVQRRPVAVSFAIAQGRTGGVATDTPTSLAAIYSPAGMDNASVDAAAKQTVNVSGSGTFPLPAPAGDSRRKIVWTDFSGVTAVTRTDGHPGYLLGCRVYVNGGGRLVLSGNGSDTFGGQETESGREARFRSRINGDVNSAASTFSVNNNGSVIIGVRYLTDEGFVCNVAAFGDSLDEGRAQPLGMGFVHRAAQAVQTATVAVEASNLAWAGSTTTQHAQHLADAIADGAVPHIAVFPSGSANDASTTLDYPKVTIWMSKTTEMLNLCRNNGITPFVRNMTPVNYAVKTFGATDALRIQHNGLFSRPLASAGVPVIDADALTSGTAHASGQIELSAAASLDGIHLTAAATEAVGRLMAAELTPLLP